MFADPISVTVNSVAQSLARTGSGDLYSVYRKDDGSHQLKITHQYGKTRSRFTTRLDHNKLVADVFVAGQSVRTSASVSLVIDMPVIGYTNAEVRDLVIGLTGWATSGNVLKVLGGET